MPLTQPFQSRETAMRGDFVRLYCTFTNNGVMADPSSQPQVRIVTNSYSQESTSSSTVSSGTLPADSSSSSSSEQGKGTGYGPFYAIRQYTGIWYVDWYVPEDAVIGDYFDMWYYQFNNQGEFEKKTFKFAVHAADAFINFETSPIVSRMGDTAVSMINCLKTNLIGEACDIPVYWEQGMIVGDNKLNFAFKNWKRDQPILLRRNNRLVNSWTPDFAGGAVTARAIEAEDMFYAHYHFSYFSDEDLLSMLNEALWVMNATPPASHMYTSVASIPFHWRGGIILYASMQALRKLIFGFTWQERAIIFGEKPEDAQRFIDNCKTLYTDYSSMWMEIRKDIKKALPAISINITPEYTLPGGRCLSSGTYIKCRVSGRETIATISELYKLSSSNTIEVLSIVKNSVSFAPVSKIWKSGRKMTFVLTAGGHSVRVSKDHLVLLTDLQDYAPTYALRKGNRVLTVRGCQSIVSPLDFDPIPYGVEDVYDLEVPSSGNLVSGGIVTHNSRWMRYMYKSGT